MTDFSTFNRKEFTAYLAGYCENKSNIIINRTERPKITSTPVYTLTVMIGLYPDRALYYAFGRFFEGVGRVYARTKSPSESWIISAFQAEVFLQIIQPYSIIKADQIKVALEFRSTFGLQTDYKGRRGRMYQTPPEILEHREDCRLKLLELKARGIKQPRSVPSKGKT